MFKALLKKIPFLLKLNAYYRAKSYLDRTRLLQEKYRILANDLDKKYDEKKVLSIFKERVSERLDNQSWLKTASKPNVFWIGTNFDQDNSGFLQDLEVVSDLRSFYQDNGVYGFISNFDSDIGTDIRKFNDDQVYKAVVKAHSERKIDIILGQMWANYLSSEVLEKIKELGIIVINVSMDDRLPEMWIDNKISGSLGLKMGIDLVLTTAKEICQWYWVEDIPAIYWPLASSPRFYHESDERDIEISFIGNNYGYRSQIINGLKNAGIPIKAFGNGWDNGYVNTEIGANILSRSKLVLGIGTVGHTKAMVTLKLRDFDAPMSGSMYITQYNPELDALFVEDKEIVYYRSIEEAVNKVKYYLENNTEQRKIAKEGRSRAIQDHTWEKRFNYILNIIKNDIC